MNVFILATCRSPELWPATEMVFKSLRVGFPTWPVTVFCNGLYKQWQERLSKCCQMAGAELKEIPHAIIHHAWIEGLLKENKDPFVICDTDVTFFGSVEIVPNVPLAGRLIPRFYDNFTKCITLPRLHTSLLYFDSHGVRSAVEKYFAEFPGTPFNPKPNLIYPGFIPVRDGTRVRSHFYDTCCLLYQAIGGLAFGPEVLDQYGHLNFGTISDIVAPHYPDEHFRTSHFAAFENPELLRGQWRRDDQWYAQRWI